MDIKPSFDYLINKIAKIEEEYLTRKEEMIRKGVKFCPYCGEVYPNTIYDINDSVCADISIEDEYNSGVVSTECFCDACGHFFILETNWTLEVITNVIEDKRERGLYNLENEIQDDENIKEFENENQLNLFESNE